MQLKKFFLIVLLSWSTIPSSFSAGEDSVNPRLKAFFDPIVKKIASQYGLDSALIHSIIATESNYDCLAISAKGAQGLMQLMPDTAKAYGVKNVFNAAENIEGGVKYLIDLRKLYSNRTEFVLAAYNAGQDAVKKFGGIPPYAETLTYIEKVKQFYTKFKKTQIYVFTDDKGRLVVTNIAILNSKGPNRTSID
jgi:soluble lytic murein transglycosylase-like protein